MKRVKHDNTNKIGKLKCHVIALMLLFLLVMVSCKYNSTILQSSKSSVISNIENNLQIPIESDIHTITPSLDNTEENTKDDSINKKVNLQNDRENIETNIKEAKTNDSELNNDGKELTSNNKILKNEDENSMISICFAGDLMCLSGQQYSAEKKDGSHDFTGSFKYVKEYISNHDIAIANLETIISESNPYSTKEKLVNEQPNCNAPGEYLDAVKLAGFDCLVTANNHCLDGAETGINETIKNLDSYGLTHTGTYNKDYSGEHYALLECKGIKIAVISVTELINQRNLVDKRDIYKMVDSYSKDFIIEQIQSAREDGAGFIVVYEHWGSENIHEVRDYQKSHAQIIADAGADIIIGSHPHCLQPLEMIETNDGREVPCFYSLGNVVSSMVNDINHDTAFISVTVKCNTNEVNIHSISGLACHVLDWYDDTARVITPVNSKINEKRISKELNEAKIRIEKIISIK